MISVKVSNTQMLKTYYEISYSFQRETNDKIVNIFPATE